MDPGRRAQHGALDNGASTSGPGFFVHNSLTDSVQLLVKARALRRDTGLARLACPLEVLGL